MLQPPAWVLQSPAHVLQSPAHVLQSPACTYVHYVLLQRVKPKSRRQDTEETTSVLTSKSCECGEGKWEGWELKCDSAEGKGEGRAEMCLSAEGGSVEDMCRELHRRCECM